MTAPDLSVVIPCRNVAGTLGAQLEALAEQRGEVSFEVVVVDNASVDATAEVARSFGDRLDLHVVRCEQPGINVARNAGVRAARSDRLAFCDGDDVVTDAWVVSMYEALEVHRYIAGRLDPEALNRADVALSRGRERAGPPTFAGVFSFAPGGNLGIHRSLLEQVGGFNEDTDALDDQELGLRIHLLGERPHLAADAAIHYRYRPDVASTWRQGLAYGRGRVALFHLVRRAGLRPPSRLGGWRSWAWLVVNLWRLRTRAGRQAWVWVAANRWGHVLGSLKFRELYL